jgi:glycosyltransferase involved in cell wall biosynthesis
VAVRHNPVDTDTFCPGPAGAATLNDVLFVGRLSPEKGLDVLLGAAARLRSGVRIAVVGKGPLRRRLERQARSTAAQWHFVDWIDHARIPDVIRSSKLVVVPSLLEGHPLVVLEAMACGIPVIAARAGGIPEVVEHGVNGWLTAAGDADALAHAIDRALADDVARCRAGQAARRTALSFSIGEFQRRTLDLYGAPEPALGAGCR